MADEQFTAPEEMEYLLPDEEDEAAPEVDTAEMRLESLVGEAVEQAFHWREEELDPQQEKATDYYFGRPYGDEVEGRSRVVSTDVRDTINGILPSLLRIFFGPEKSVEYEPRGPEDVETAEQLTDMAGVVIRKDNDGFLQIHGAMKDAMVRKLGVLKVFWEEKETVEGHELTGISEPQLRAILADEDNEVEVLTDYAEAAPDMPTGFITLYDVYVKRRTGDGRVRFMAVPPEEFVFSPDARDRDTADMMGHVRPMPASELIAMGIDPELVAQHKGRTNQRAATSDDLEQARRFDRQHHQEWYETVDDAREDCLFGEVYVYADMSEPDETGEQSGEAHLIKARVIGDSYELVDWEYASCRPFALFVCDPEPHTLIGLSTADYVMDIQRIKSALMRGMLDSLTQSLNPRTVASIEEVDFADLMNHEVGGVIRVERDVNAVKEFVHRFDQSGASAFPMLEYMDQQKEDRTGQSKAAMGLDADALQSSTKAAVAATLSASQQRIEMLARVFAETGFKQLYELILQMLVEHQQRSRMVRLRGKWVEMNPEAWHDNLDVKINLALGAGGTEEKLQLLGMITAHQKQLLDEGSPLVDQPRYRAGLARMVELAGFPNADEFYKPWGEAEEQQYRQAMSQQQPPPNPAMMAMQMEAQIEAAKLQLEREKAQWDYDLDRAKAEMDFAIKQATAEAQYGTQINDQEIRADVATAKAIIEAAAKEAAAKAQGGANVPTNGIPGADNATGGGS